MKKLFFAFTALLFLPLTAQGIEVSDIDSIMEDNSFQNVSNRYDSVLFYFFPEATTRLGMTLGNRQLNIRTPQRTEDAVRALTPITQDAQEINAKLLSSGKDKDYHLFTRNLLGTQSQLRQGEILKNPLYYAAAFDAVYDLNLRLQDPMRQRLSDIRARLHQLPQTADQAAKNLVTPPPFLAQLAMEKAYYAFLSFDEIQTELEATASDAFAKQDIQQEMNTAKQAIRTLFEQFKALSQQDVQTDYRMGSSAYTTYLKDVYYIDTDSHKLARLLEDYLTKAQHNLFDALLPFEQSADENMMVLDESGMLLESEETDSEETEEIPAPKKAKKEDKKKQKREYIPPTAGQYFALAQHFDAPQVGEDMLSLLTAEANSAADMLAESNIVPALSKTVTLEQMPTYHAYFEPYLFIPAESIDSFFLRAPNGNTLNQQEMLQRDFNAPMRKVFISRQLVPGRFYQYHQTKNLSKQRRGYGSATLQNGWSAFAQRLAQKGNLFVEDEELLAAAFAEYEQAIKAWVDFQLNTRQFSYAQATQFLVEENGFTQEQAEQILREVILNPAQNVSTIVGLDTFEKVYKKYAKKVNKKFTHADLINLFLKTGNVLPADLEPEITRLYKEKTRR